MSKGGNTLIYLAGGVTLVYLVSRSFSTFSRLYTVTVGRVRFNDSLSRGSFYSRIFFDVTLNINNPTGFQGRVTGSRLNILYQGRVIGFVQSSSVVDVKANAITPLVVSVGVPVAAIFDDVATALMALAQRRPVSLQITGTVATSAGAINVNQTVGLSY